MLPRSISLLSVAALLGGAFLGTSAHAQNTRKNHIPDLSSEQWRQDLHVLATEVARRHKNAFAYTRKSDFYRAVADLDARIPSLNGYGTLVGMMSILAMIGDGHTRCDDLFNSFSQFPIDLYWFGDELRVIRATPEYKDALGARVLVIEKTQWKLLTRRCARSLSSTKLRDG
jgi:hypothetical protein